VATDLRERLQSTLGSSYTLERELGGGGMSRVFVADETAFGRKVVVKVLPPDLAAGVSVDRFKREIQVAARLQHPHIVPVLSAGESDGLPFYTMPFVEGASLRGRLAKGGLAMTEVVGVLREVARALAYAHEHGVVHRDIKPDNVMLSGGSAVVTDFGIAKAISAARADAAGTSATLTQIGTSIGTPAYMAPEQAAGDPDTNHRADIYAFGAMAYELLAGRTPFHGLPLHKMLAAHMSETPAPVANLRPDTPAALAELVMRCLDKDPDKRPQSAADVARVLETVTSASGQPAMPAAMLGGRSMLWKALALYVAAFVVVAVLARAAIVGIGLPDWVFPGSLVVMALGLPVILFTAFVHRQTHRALTTTPVLTPGGSPTTQSTLATIAIKASPHVSWRRTAIGGVIAVGAFIALVGGWMLLRALGVGPDGSLMAAGRMSERERVVIADFSGKTSDSLLAPTITEAFRTALAESPNLNIMSAVAVRDVLRRMQRTADTTVDFALAREVATREGIKAVIDGNVTELGGSYVLSARLVAAQTGDEIATFRETADEAKEIIPAIGRLSRKLRSRVGESLKGVQQALPLDQVTTPSLPALQKYVAANRAMQLEGDFAKGLRLLEEAIALDTSFAMAYRRIATELNNRQLDPVRVQTALQKAYDHRDRMSDAERYLALASYYSYGPKPDIARSISSLESLVDLQPDNAAALNNLANAYRQVREHAKAEVAASRALASQQSMSVIYRNLVWSQMAVGKVAAAESTLALMASRLPQNPSSVMSRALVLAATGRRDSAFTVLDSLRRARPSDLAAQNESAFSQATISAARGRIREFVRLIRESADAALQQGTRSAPLDAAIDAAQTEAWFLEQPPRAVSTLDRAIADHPLDSLSPVERPYTRLARAYALAGQPDRARTYLAAFDRRTGEIARGDDNRQRHSTLGYIAMAERRYDDAAREFQASDQGACTVCALPDLARAYDLAGNADSAIVVFSRYIDAPSEPTRAWDADAFNLAGAHKRLGELYEAKGEKQKAASHYAAFVDLWKDADPELQPLVRRVRERLTTIQRAERP
jgi:tetratricopeptide (TPR) repeat protein/tRNA A-37 threonylcarbamoyl transferase component Bud32